MFTTQFVSPMFKNLLQFELEAMNGGRKIKIQKSATRNFLKNSREAALGSGFGVQILAFVNQNFQETIPDPTESTKMELECKHRVWKDNISR